MATRLMLSLKKAADESGSFRCTGDLEVMTDVLFAGGPTTMEHAMETGVSRRDRDWQVAGTQGAIELQPVETPSRWVAVEGRWETSVYS